MEGEDFDVFKLRYVVEGELVSETMLHVGAAETSSGTVDNPFMKVEVRGRTVPFIPGSSLKGALRAEAERIARGKNVKGVAVCTPPKVCDGDDVCVVCRIFGSKKLASHVKIPDAYPIGEVSTLIKPGVAIDRVLGAVFTGQLYMIEAVPPGARFRFKMIIDNIDLEGGGVEAEILRALLRELASGSIQIGGRKSAGMGFVRLENVKVRKITVDDILEGREGSEISLEGLDARVSREC
ncbi:MAG: RAMP superfamily CRISPR-associated protein [Candidatus Freyarchaeota archaeon]